MHTKGRYSFQPATLSRRRFVSLGAAAAWTLALQRQAYGEGLTPVSVATAPDEDAVACLYAQQSEIFRQRNLAVTVSPSSSGSAIASAVAGGTIDIGKSSLTGLVSAYAHGVPFRLIAPSAMYSTNAPVTGTVVRADSTIRLARDLAGKTVSVPSLKGEMQIATMAWIDQHGGDSSNVHFIELPATATFQAVQSGRVDAATFANPALADALQSKRVRVLGWTSDAIAKQFLLAAYFCTVDFTQRNPDVVARFARGIELASMYTNTHPAQTIALVSKFTSVRAQNIARMTRVTCGLALNPRDIQPVIDASLKYKMIASRFDASDMIEPALLERTTE